MALELAEFLALHRVERVAAGQGVQVVALEPHQLTSMQSRIRIRPSLILVFTVPRATPSSFATCG